MLDNSDDRLRVAVLGASGYTGAELVRLLARHPHVEIMLLTAERHAHEPVAETFPHLGSLDLPGMLPISEVEWSGVDIDLAYCALPHGATHAIVAGLLHESGHDLVDELVNELPEDLIAAMNREAKVIDLSPDFRLDPETYAHWYGQPHGAPSLQAEAVYGLTEFAREAVRAARLIACPGCYPTAALLPLVPLVESGQIETEGIIIDAKSGVTGAGRAAKEASLFAEVSEGIHAYAVGGHRHAPEIEKMLSAVAEIQVTVNFTPHLIPMNRGILATTYVELAGQASAADLRECLLARYRDEPFVGVLDERGSPATRHVRGSNHCLMAVYGDRLPGRAIILSVIDNLVKGAAGQAIQNMNLMYGFDETAGLEQVPLFP